jgi:2-polyprenyl-3-methyl-5-hydroxy-6-metoxy-1,4-benzoquinol methylase
MMSLPVNPKKQNNDGPVDFDDYARSYEDTLNASLALCAETSAYFYSYKVDCLKRRLKDLDKRHSVLDFGSGIGTLSAMIAEEFSHWTIFGYDVSRESIERAKRQWSRLENLTFVNTWPEHVKFDIIIAANVFHHIPINVRHDILRNLRDLLKPDGRIVIFEHNPWNPLTRLVVRNCEFDRDAELISATHFIEVAWNSGLDTCHRQYIVFFPNLLKIFRPLEHILGWLPLGAQYMLTLKAKS